MRKLGEILIHEGLVAPHHVDRALLWQRDDGGRIGSLLIRLGYLEEREFLRLMAAQLRTRPVLVREQSLDPTLLALVPAETARQANAVPIAIHADHLIVATCDPHNVRALREIEAATGHPVEAWLAADPTIATLLDRFYPRDVHAQSLALVPVGRSLGSVAVGNPRASVEPLIRAWIEAALDAGAGVVTIRMTHGGLRVIAAVSSGDLTIAEPHPSLHREILRRLRQSAGLRPAVAPARRESGSLPYVRGGERLRLGLAFIPDEFGYRVRLDLAEARGIVAGPARDPGCAGEDRGFAERLAS